MSISFECKNCGKTIAMSEKKFGFRVRCSYCRAINKTPGIAFQKEASAPQIGKMAESLARYRHALWGFIILFPFLTALAMTIAPYSWPLAIVTFSVAFLLLVRTTTVRQYLGKGIIALCFWFFAFFPAFMIMSVISYFRLKKRLATLALSSNPVD